MPSPQRKTRKHGHHYREISALINLKTWLGPLIRSFFFPPRCIGCGQMGRWICSVCRARYLIRAPPECVVCRKISTGSVTHPHCASSTLLREVVICWRYNRFAKKTMKLFKYKLRYAFGIELARLAAPIALASLLKQPALPAVSAAEVTASARQPIFTSSSMRTTSSPATLTVLVPVPSGSRRMRERGFNQSNLIAEELGKATHVPVARLLRAADTTEHQAGKSRTDRLKKSAHSFSIDPHVPLPPYDSPIVLVDDVCTTGATLNACAEVLEIQGYTRISAVALFRSARRNPP